MTNITATFQCPAVSPTLPAGQLPPVKLNTHRVEFHHGPTSPRAQVKQTGAKQAGKWLFDMTDEERRAFLSRSGVLQVKSTEPDPIENSMTSQGALQRGFWGMLYDNTLGVLENALAEDETKPETVKPDRKQTRTKRETARTGPSVDRPSMESFLKHIEGKFTCERLGQPCVARPGQPRAVLIGWEHTGISEEWGEELIAFFKRPGDKVIVEVAPSALEKEKTRKMMCMGLSKEDCIAGEIDIVKDALDEAGMKLIELEYLMLSVLDSEAALRIWVDNHDKRPEDMSRLLLGQYERSVPLRAPLLSAEQAAEINLLHQLSQELKSKMLEWNGVREQNYIRVLEREMTNQEGTIFVPIGAAHVENIRRSFANDDRVVVLMPTRLGEPRRNPSVFFG